MVIAQGGEVYKFGFQTGVFVVVFENYVLRGYAGVVVADVVETEDGGNQGSEKVDYFLGFPFCEAFYPFVGEFLEGTYTTGKCVF